MEPIFQSLYHAITEGDIEGAHEHVRQALDALKQAGVREQVKVVAGGAPLTETFAEQIGADGYGPDANRAVLIVQSLKNQHSQH